MRRITLIAAISLVATACVPQSAMPVPSSTSPPEAPVPLPKAGALDPGTYFLANPNVDNDPVRSCDRGCSDYQRIIFTLPAGWATSDGFVHKHHGEPDELAFSAWTVDSVYADPCRWQESPMGPLDEIHPEVHDAPGNSFTRSAGGLANQAHRGPLPRELTGVLLGGEFAARIDLSVPAELDISSCDDGEFRSWTEWDVADGANSHHFSGQFDTIYIVDVDRRPLVIDASYLQATSEEDLAELKAILASMIVDR